MDHKLIPRHNFVFNQELSGQRQENIFLVTIYHGFYQSDLLLALIKYLLAHTNEYVDKININFSLSFNFL